MVKRVEVTTHQYDTPDGYINGMRQLQRTGVSYFIRVHKPRARKSKIVAVRGLPQSKDVH